LLLGLDWFVVIGHKWNDYRNVIPEVYPKLFGVRLARNIHRLFQFALSYKRWSTGISAGLPDIHHLLIRTGSLDRRDATFGSVLRACPENKSRQ
jgi:hypothetical protein